MSLFSDKMILEVQGDSSSSVASDGLNLSASLLYLKAKPRAQSTVQVVMDEVISYKCQVLSNGGPV